MTFSESFVFVASIIFVLAVCIFGGRAWIRRSKGKTIWQSLIGGTDILLPGLIAVFLAIELLISPLLRYWWSPWWLERMSQRKTAAARVESAGGWEKLKVDCTVLARRSKEETGAHYFHWSRWVDKPDVLPPAIASLMPMRVEVTEDSAGIPTVVIRLWGMRASGGRGTPLYVFQVLCGATTNGYIPKQLSGGGTADHDLRKITDGVFEVY